MARFIAIFDDNTDVDWIRKEHRLEHLSYLEANKGEIAVAGALQPDIDAGYVGALWVFNVTDKAAAIRLIENDPYFKLGLRKKYEVRIWGKPPFFGPVTI